MPLPRLIDAALAAGLAATGLSAVVVGWPDGNVGASPDGDLAVRAGVVVLCTLPLAARRARPLTVVAIICAALVGQLLFVVRYAPLVGGLLPMAIANYSAAVYGTARWRAASLLPVAAVEAVLYARVPSERATGEVLFGVFVALGTWLVGDVVRARVQSANRHAGALLAEREAAAAVALADERARIARELHDVIAHGVSLMGVQAGAARVLLDSDPDQARDALKRIEDTARGSVAELRRLLTLLRPDSGDPDARDPQPGLARLPEVVDRVRAAGLPLDLHVEGIPPDLPTGLDLAAYRIVQEALTNALKHAAAPTSVRVTCVGGQLDLEIRDTGTGGRGEPGVGHGLAGMHERALLYGGVLSAQRDPRGGFVVHARLPASSEAGR